ncbi:hypothetical protein TBLA_0A08630 [Henningerozyma blattae CBS 6284]|uniref:Uncharacterized protein n=1 Tax=Henningerozyma blattae (strain ATCC 34711 / CBS 6284 / DSM 70876 / NBRC 10599 / NRRL Y-10934 / UCD 77-7) TaxID=1071380 RepID=I2GX00_HENB6|nr:hypothetical protein TBLA_0A08630 [Tetrapisispora blattae CBS 6284]CCH58652.1 hypothetical protein TBLA_0A08630 [Tetrapisispora blattae CBS 6284]
MPLCCVGIEYRMVFPTAIYKHRFTCHNRIDCLFCMSKINISLTHPPSLTPPSHTMKFSAAALISTLAVAASAQDDNSTEVYSLASNETEFLNLTDFDAPLNITFNDNTTYVNGTNISTLVFNETTGNITNITLSSFNGSEITGTLTNLTGGALGFNCSYVNGTLILKETLTKLVTVPTEDTTFVTNGATYSATANQSLTITDCPCVATRVYVRGNITEQFSANDTRFTVPVNGTYFPEDEDKKKKKSNAGGKLVPAFGLAQLVMMML